MNNEVSPILSLRAAYDFGKKHGLAAEMTAIREMDIEWDLTYNSSLRRGYVLELLKKKGLLEEFKKQYWLGADTPAGRQKQALYVRLKARYESFLAGHEDEVAQQTIGVDGEHMPSFEFALEAHLRDFLARNLERLEAGLRLHATDEDDGIEYSVDGGRIDLLAIDARGRYVVIELKLSQGRNRALGQLLYYMGWVDQHLGNGPCRGIIVASEISEELLIAASRVPGIELAEYHMSFSIEPRTAGLCVPAV